MYKNILLAIDLNDETSSRKPLLSAVELARTFGARLHVLTVVREVEAILEAKTAPLGYGTDIRVGCNRPIVGVRASWPTRRSRPMAPWSSPETVMVSYDSGM